MTADKTFALIAPVSKDKYLPVMAPNDNWNPKDGVELAKNRFNYTVF
jgi:hypothetical protein|tara:strand:- start:1118 stop:1258 length:141 start_codon:yes stop_codon:yes gene_type:complete